MGCSFRPDWVAGFLRIRWQLCTGLGGRNHRNTQEAEQARLAGLESGFWGTTEQETGVSAPCWVANVYLLTPSNFHVSFHVSVSDSQRVLQLLRHQRLI